MNLASVTVMQSVDMNQQQVVLSTSDDFISSSSCDDDCLMNSGVCWLSVITSVPDVQCDESWLNGLTPDHPH